jgi:phage shock protein C
MMRKKKRLKRDEERAVVAGVMSGLANYFDQDPVLFRVAAIVFLVLTGIFPGLLIYLAAWIIMPTQTKDEPKYDYEVE